MCWTVSNLNIYAQRAQHTGTGFVQLFGLLASFEFAYFIAPRSARSLFMSLSFVARGIASSIVLAFMVHLAKPSSRIDFSVSINILYDRFSLSDILRIVPVSKQRMMATLCLFLHSYRFANYFHYNFYHTPTISPNFIQFRKKFWKTVVSFRHELWYSFT